MNNILTIIKKELRRFFTDKRMLISFILPGLIIYILYSVMGSFMGDAFMPSEDYTYNVIVEDMPDEYNQPEMDEERMKRWAASIGENTAEVIDRIFRSVNIKEQGYNSALSVLKLAKSYSDKRLEIACEIALTSIRVPRYHHLKTILSGNQDKIYLAQKEELKVREQNKQTLGYVRGAAYYGGYDDDK